MFITTLKLNLKIDRQFIIYNRFKLEYRLFTRKIYIFFYGNLIQFKILNSEAFIFNKRCNTFFPFIF